MEQTADHRERIAAAIQVDRLFSAYEIEMTPMEALDFIEMAPAAGSGGSHHLHELIFSINRAIPPIDFGSQHGSTGKAHHVYRIGRERGLRMIKVEVFKGFFQVDYDFIGLMEKIHLLGTRAGAEVAIEADNNAYSIQMRWGGTLK